VPGDLKKSELWARVITSEAEDKMPPRKSGKKLSSREVALLKRWIEQGAVWQGHWAFLPLEKPPAAKTKDGGWGRNPVDAYILARLEEEGLRPSPERTGRPSPAA
jgi:hypothetical protein